MTRVLNEELAALGGQLGNHPRNINARIQELLIPEAKTEAYTSKAKWETKRAEIMENLRSVVLRNMPADINRVTKTVGEHGINLGAKYSASFKLYHCLASRFGRQIVKE